MPAPSTVPARHSITDVPPAPARHDLTLTVLSVLLMLVLIIASFWVLRPFVLSVVWATMIVVATWPMMLKVQAALRRRALAVAVMSAAMLLVFIAPFTLAVRALVENMDAITRFVRALPTATIPPPPEWLQSIPLVGTRVAEQWAAIAATDKGELASRLAPYAADAVQWLAGAFGSVGILIVQLLLTIIVSVVMFANGEAARAGLIRFGRCLAGEQGHDTVVLAGRAIRGVAMGVVVTALAQTVLAGLGLFAAGIPFAGLLTGAILLLCIAQMGPVIVLVPAVIWLFYTGQTGWGSALLVWTVLVGAMDNVLRPLLIRKGGADLPLLLIFAGVIGGLVAFGIVGLFVGPVVLAVAYTLMLQWMAQRERSA